METCTEASHRLGEPIGGTAVADTRRWLLIQVHSGWKAKTIDAEPLRGGVRTHIESELARIGGARLQLIRRPGVEDGVVVFAVTVCEHNPRVVRVVVPTIDAVLGLDIGELFDGGAGGQIQTDPLVLVCTHGLRDRCCAKKGMPVFDAVHQHLEDGVWQTTHLGGHRFAATLVVLPMGLQFGRVLPSEVPQLLEGVARGEIYDLDRFRGVVSQGRLEQVTIDQLRRRNGCNGVHDIRMISPDEYELKGQRVRVLVRQTPHDEPRPYSCGDETLKTPAVYSVSALD